MRATTWASLFLALLLGVHQWEFARAQDEDADGEEDAAEMLARFDKDDDQKLSVDELLDGFKELATEDGVGHDHLVQHEEIVRRLFPDNDRDGDGLLDLDELKSLESHFEDEIMKEEGEL